MHVASPRDLPQAQRLATPGRCDVYVIPDPQWIDLRVAVAGDMIIELYVGRALRRLPTVRAGVLADEIASGPSRASRSLPV